MRVKQEITSLIQNFAWETDPNWDKKILEIHTRIGYFWDEILDRPRK